MRSMKRMTIATAAFGVVVAGAVTGLALTGGTAARAGQISSCTGTTSSPASCTLTAVVVTNPITIELFARFSPNSLSTEFKWTTDCKLSGNDTINSGTDTVKSEPAWDVLDLKVSNPDQCTVTATATVVGTPPSGTTASLGDFEIDSNQNTPSASPSASSSSTGSTRTVHQSHGFDGTCLDDKGNSSAVRATVQIWTCNSTDMAQNWSYSGSELHHGRMCLNAKGNGKSGSKLILWSCNGAANEIFIHRSNGEMVEKANGYKFCIDDPGYSTRNGTQLIVYACHNTPNQHWSVP